jgi:hypothetical protein
VWEKSYLFDVKDKKHSNRDIVQNPCEDIKKEMEFEGNQYLNIIYMIITILLVWNIKKFP